ncbi:MAG TPA: kelch repeat-containing protein, partial [Candidatus Binataceae bacterium]|nr:kelch repeat-containing protein [Candidatus Binataceae bacterium]
MVVLIFAIALILATSSMVRAQAPGTFAPTGFMKLARVGATATMLRNGKILVAGGYYYGIGNSTAPVTCENGNTSQPQFITNTAEIYDPTTGTFSATGNMSIPRTYHTATLLPNGKVLVAGGYDGCEDARGKTEIYDPVSGTFTPGPNMVWARAEFTATRLASGKVLMAFGHTTGQEGFFFSTDTAEVYDPVANTFTEVSGCNDCVGGYYDQAATLLLSGRVLVSPPGMYYDPTLPTEPSPWVNTTNNPNPETVNPSSTLLSGGDVLLAGGTGSHGLSDATDTSIYNPATNSFAAGPEMLNPHALFTGTALANGEILMAGGAVYSPTGKLISQANAELYDPTSNSFVATGDMTIA